MHNRQLANDNTCFCNQHFYACPFICLYLSDYFIFHIFVNDNYNILDKNSLYFYDSEMNHFLIHAQKNPPLGWVIHALLKSYVIQSFCQVKIGITWGRTPSE